MTDKTKSHHHGDLHNALVRAGLELLKEGGSKALTIRGCAARAGVSHAAPKHHFNSLDDLRHAVAIACFEVFNRHMLSAAAKAEQTPRARLKAICRGYLAFALAEPAYFEAIFTDAALVALSPDVGENPDGAYITLRAACAPFVAPHENPAIVETQVWSLIHGYAQLVRMGRFADGSMPPEGPFDAVMTLLDALPLAEA